MLWLAHYGPYEEALAAASEGAQSADDATRSLAQSCFAFIVRAYRRIDLGVVLPLIRAGLCDRFTYAALNAEEALTEMERWLPDFSREDHGIAPPAFTAERDRLDYLAQSGRHRSETLALATLMSRSDQPDDRCAAMFAFSKLAWRHHALDSPVADRILRAGLTDADADVKICAQLAINNITRQVPRTPVTEWLFRMASPDQADDG